MDRNFFIGVGVGNANVVALRKESVDRNPDASAVESVPVGVALRKESVDRNQDHRIQCHGGK